MGGALAYAASKVLSADRIAVSDLDPARVEPFVREKKATAAELAEVVRESRYIFLAVKPQGLAGLFDQISGILKKRQDHFVLVSMAAGVPIERIAQLAGMECPIIRMMPNTPVRVGQGMILYAANDKASGEDVEGYLNGLSGAGKFDAIPEKLIDAAGALSGCGPAFVYLFAEALADGGVWCGLPRDKANLYAAQTLAGAAELLLSSGTHPGALKDAVCSPGGTTIEGVRTLENGAFRGTVTNAVVSAYEKTKKL